MNLDLVTNLVCVRRFGAFPRWEMAFVKNLGCQRGFVTFSRFGGPGNEGWQRLPARNGPSSTCSQLRALGITRGSYEHRVRGRARCIGSPRACSRRSIPLIERWTAETAALLYAGDNAVLSHESAAAVWGLAAIPSFVAITLIRRHIRSQPGLVIHRVKSLDIRDVQIHARVPGHHPGPDADRLRRSRPGRSAAQRGASAQPGHRRRVDGRDGTVPRPQGDRGAARPAQRPLRAGLQPLGCRATAATPGQGRRPGPAAVQHPRSRV